MMIGVATYGMVNMEVYFSLDLYVTPEWRIYDFRRIKWDYFPATLYPETNVRAPDDPISLEEN